MRKYWECIDANSEYCPCYLAETGDCISCSQLGGENFCYCQWNGICIYDKFCNTLKSDIQARENYIGEIIEKKEYKNNLIILKVKTEEDLIKHLKEPGSYVFIKGINDKDYFQTPMSILKIDSKETLYIAYQEIGCKTKNLKDKKEINIKGPYWHGILGNKYFKSIANSKVLVIARGIGQSSILLAIEKLLGNNNKVFILLDKGKLDALYIYDFLDNKDKLIIKELDLFSEYGNEYVKSLLKKEDFNLILSGGSNMLHRKVKGIINSLNIKPYFLTSNNGILCCGEGVCGSCTMKSKDKVKVKLCKSIINPNKLY